MPMITSQSAGTQYGMPGSMASLRAAPQALTFGPDQEAIAKTQADASMYPAKLRDQHFQQLFPMLSKGFGALGGGFGSPATAGGASGQGPAISAGPVWNPQQIQQQVNSSRAQTDASTQTQQKATGEQAAGRGFSSQSPLTLALQGQEAGQGMATNAQNQNQIQWGAAEGNSKSLLAGQQAREGQFASRQQEDIQRRLPYFQQQNALISALGGMI